MFLIDFLFCFVVVVFLFVCLFVCLFVFVVVFVDFYVVPLFIKFFFFPTVVYKMQDNLIFFFAEITWSAMKTHIIKYYTNKNACSHSSKLQPTGTNSCPPFTPKHSSILTQLRRPRIPISSQFRPVVLL